MRQAALLAPLIAAVAASCFPGVSSCGGKERGTVSAHRSVLMEDMPHVAGTRGFEGEACARMVLEKLGKDIDQDDVFDLSGVDPAEGRGCRPEELAGALRRVGFEVGEVRRPAGSVEAAGEELWALHRDLVGGIASIVHVSGRFLLVVGYDAARDEVVFHDPAEEDGARRRMARSRFIELWPQGEGAERAVVRLGMKPGELIDAPPEAEGFTNADYARHVRLVRGKMPEGFTLVLERPFVVIGDEPQPVVKKRARLTVKWAVDRLKKDFFTKDPDDIIDIWLFRDGESYLRHAELLFGDEPGTPYGYYNAAHKALVMNIATGGGTLVHEIVHPFVASNFPGCPPWLDEGLASLYERCEDRDGRIHGLTNWRLAGLKEAVERGILPSFEELTSMNDNEFYTDELGTNYGQSRYLCYYLQEHGLLVDYYHAFHENRKEDPTGYETLRKIMGVEDMDAFKKKWEQWVMKLVFE